MPSVPRRDEGWDATHVELGVEAVDAGAQVGVRLLRRRRAQGLHLQRAQRRVRRVRLQLLLLLEHVMGQLEPLTYAAISGATAGTPTTALL